MTRILVVDDDPDFVEITRLILRSRDYTVETASNGEMALRMMRESPPDLVLLDVIMASVLDGYHLAQTMNQDRALHQIPVIMVSSITSGPMADRLPTDEYLPIDAWITKPVQPDDLLNKIARLLSRNGNA
jgi:CheY-like chemotaxis protein